MDKRGNTLDAQHLREAIEAILFTGICPLTSTEFARAFPEAAPAAFESAIASLRQQYEKERRPYAIRRRETGYTLELTENVKKDLEARALVPREATLSRSVIEVLSVVAYRQPIEKVAIEQILGLECGPVLRQLVRRGLLTTMKHESAETPAFITTQRFLDLFHLESLADLPASEDLGQY